MIHIKVNHNWQVEDFFYNNFYKLGSVPQIAPGNEDLLNDKVSKFKWRVSDAVVSVSGGFFFFFP